MLRLSKSLVCFGLVLAISLAQFSCQPQQVSLPPDVDETKQPIQSDNREPLLSPIEIPYLVANPLEIIYAQDQVKNSHSSTLLINGLTNREIEDKINARLVRLYMEIKTRDLPPYRGIKTKIPANSELVSNDLNVYVSFNYNNVISVVIKNNRSYRSHYVSITETLNLDLNTGEEITLADVFTDDVDHVNLVNDHVSRLIMNSTATEETYGAFDDSYWGGGHILKLVSPFKGILPDQKFHLFQGGISLVFDHNNPEFDTSMFMPVSLPVYFCDTGRNIAVTQRFYAEDKDIFTNSSPPAKEFVQTEYLNTQQRFIRQQNIGATGHARMSYSYPECVWQNESTECGS